MSRLHAFILFNMSQFYIVGHISYLFAIII